MPLLLSQAGDWGALLSPQFLTFGALTLGALIGLGASLIFGSDHDSDGDGDSDVDHEIGSEMDQDTDHETETEGQDGHDTDERDHVPSFLSPRVCFAFLLGLGAAGTGATAYGFGPFAASFWGIVIGIPMAIAVWGLGYFLFRQQINSGLKAGQVLGSTGTVTATIPPNKIGEVDVLVNGQIVTYLAMSSENESIPSGTPIIVVQDLGSRVSVQKHPYPLLRGHQ